MQHNADDKTEESENMLDDEEFVPEIAYWGESREV
jgi:hypothetical protein